MLERMRLVGVEGVIECVDLPLTRCAGVQELSRE